MVDLEDPAAADQGARSGRRGGRRPGRGPGSGRGPRRAARRPGARAGRPAATTGAPSGHRDDARRRRATSGGQQGAGPAAAGGARAVRRSAGRRSGAVGVEDLAGDPLDDRAGRRWDQRRSCPAGSWSRPVTIAESRAPRASRSPSGSERLTPATRSSSSVVSRVVNRPRVRCQVAAAAGAGEPEAPVGDDVPADRRAARRPRARPSTSERDQHGERARRARRRSPG